MLILLIHAGFLTGYSQSQDDTNGIFSDETDQAGLDFVHFNGMSGKFYYCEMVGGGGALFDYDNDGDLDLYVVQGHMLGEGDPSGGAGASRAEPAAMDRLYRNDLVVQPDGTRRVRFTDVTASSGIQALGYGMGAAAADFDNDGWVDLYVMNFGPNQMFRNRGDGTFMDVTGRTGTGDGRWGVSAAFLDYDRDGWLDLFLGNYVDFRFSNQKRCHAPSGAVDYCGPLGYEPVPNRLYRNRRDGSFEDVSARSQISREYHGALGVVAADLNSDGWPDVYVANDQRPNDLWINQKDGTFMNESLLAGAAFNRDGMAESSMGVDAADFDNDGDEDLFITHLKSEKNTLYTNDGTGFFKDASLEANLAVSSLPFTAFGTRFFDYDNDGWLDLFAANGEVRTIETLARRGDPYPLHQPNQLFRNLGDGRFQEVTSEAGSVFRLSEVSRGAAFGDVDNDGDTDVLLFNNNGRTRLLINRAGSVNRWLGLRLVGRESNRDALGAWAGVFRKGKPTLWRRVRTDGSYASSNDPRVLVGLGETPEVIRVRAQWPSGLVEEWPDIEPGRYVTLREGSGEKKGMSTR